MRTFFLFSLSTFALAAAGDYKGTGEWKDDQGKSGKYTVSTSFVPAQDFVFMKNDYRTEDGKAREFYLRARLDRFGFLSSHGVEGYCAASYCHYMKRHETGDSREETLIFDKDRLDKAGSETTAGRRVLWVEHLTH